MSNFFYLYSPNILVIESRKIRWAGNVTRVGERRGAYRVLVRKCEGIGPLGRTRYRWEYNIKMDNQEVGWGMDWINMTWGRYMWLAVVDVVMTG
jgi:hypothetical protein